MVKTHGTAKICLKFEFMSKFDHIIKQDFQEKFECIYSGAEFIYHVTPSLNFLNLDDWKVAIDEWVAR